MSIKIKLFLTKGKEYKRKSAKNVRIYSYLTIFTLCPKNYP